MKLKNNKKLNISSKVLIYARIKLRNLWKYKLNVFYFLHYLKLGFRSNNHKSRKYVQFNLEYNSLRYLLGLVYYFFLADYNIIIYCSPKTFVSLYDHKFTRELFKLPGLRLSYRKNNSKASLILSDHEMIKTNKSHIRINYDYFRNSAKTSVYRIPLTFHPENLLQNNLAKSGIDFNSNNRNVRLFFIGNLSQEYRFHVSIKNDFGCLTRDEAINIISNNFKNPDLRFAQSLDDLYNSFDQNTKIVLCDGKKNPVCILTPIKS